MTQRATPRQVNLLRDGICLAEWEVRHVGAKGCTHAVQPHDPSTHRDCMTRLRGGHGAGPDVFMLFNNHPQIYSESLVDMSDVCDAVAKAQGTYYDLAKSNSAEAGKWISAPWAVVGALIVYRKSWFEEIGYSSFPDTWEKYRDAAKKLKAKGRTIGQTVGHSFR